ncbi:unnamed protein product [Urochloa humidicola]
MGCSMLGCLCSSSKDGPAAARATPAEQARPGGSRNSREVAIIAADVPELTLRELKKATDKFSASRLIGRGAHAEVFRATLSGGRDAAAKRLVRTTDADDVGNLRQQVAVASRLRHENVVRLLGYNLTADHPVLLYELADHPVLLLFEGFRAKVPGHNVFKEVAPPVDENHTMMVDRRWSKCRRWLGSIVRILFLQFAHGMELVGEFLI